MTTQRQWWARPLRITQTVLREIDAVGYDAAEVVRYLQESHSNALVVNAGGIFDFFPSPLPFASPVPFLGKRDILAEITQACRSAGIKVITRVDFRGVQKHLWQQHPDWFACNADGSPVVRGQQSLELCAPCYESYYRNEHAEAFIRHLFERYGIDGVWHNAVLMGGICYCDRCKARYAAEVGGPIPRDGQDLEPYWAFKARSARRNLERLRAACKSYGDDRVYVAEVFSMFDVGRPKETGIDLYDARDTFDFLVSVAFLTENAQFPRWFDLRYAGSIVRFLRSLDPAKEPVVLFGGNGTSHRYVMDPPVDTRVWLWEAAANSGGFWNCLFNGQHPGATHDRRNAMVAADVYGFVEKNEDVLDGQVPVRDLAVYYSKPTKDRFGSDDQHKDAYTTAVQGLETVLVDEHIPYGFLSDAELSPEALRTIRVLALANAACLSDEQCGWIREWVRGGGNLLATFETSLYDQDGKARRDFGLADVFGCRYAGSTIDTQKDCYQAIEIASHELLTGIKDTTMIINAGRTAMATATGAQVICRVVPIIVNQPPERAWRETIPGEEASLTVHRFGKGTVVYFANQADRMSLLHGHPDFRTTLANAARLLLGDALVLRVEAPESVHIALTRRHEDAGKGATWVLSLINHTSAPVRPLRSLVPVRDLRVELRVGPARHRVLRADGAVDVRTEKGRTRIEIEKLEEFCCIAFEV
jgi:hypothetical protein